MATPVKREVWLRGPVKYIPAMLQPVAHALMQAQEELGDIVNAFPEDRLWEKPAGMASVGFHLQHLSGVLDRLFTYARGEQLSPEQLEYLAHEASPAIPGQSCGLLVENFNHQVAKALVQLRTTSDAVLGDTRMVGRQQIPSTVIGLLFHAAEHTQRHIGQLLVTAAVVKNQ